MNNLISEKQARAITGGRMPLVPVEYEQAIKALVACSNLDEAKYWADKSDALAAWAKIYKSDEAGLEARRLKLHAYRRMGQLALELQPVKLRNTKVWNDKSERNKQWRARQKSGEAPQPRPSPGFLPGPRALLVEKGLNEGQAANATKIAKIPAMEFDAIVNSPRPPAPNRLRETQLNTDLKWRDLSQCLYRCKALMEVRGARDSAMVLSDAQFDAARSLCKYISDWLDEFEQHLPKTKCSTAQRDSK